MRMAIGVATAAFLIFNAQAALAGAPLKGVHVKLGKTADARCAAGASTGAVPMKDAATTATGAAEAPSPGCTATHPAANPAADTSAPATKATKTRSNIQNN